MSIEHARQIAAQRFPASLTDSLGREQVNIPHRAILAGHWDNGSIVQEALVKAKGARG